MSCSSSISIHAPLAGCDLDPAKIDRHDMISIHAPLAGCDKFGFLRAREMRNFNPRTPCGVRQNVHEISHTARIFQSTHPLRGATLRVYHHFPVIQISIHAPLAGCDSKIAEIFPADLRKSYKISAKPNKERRCRVLGKGKAAAISGLARCEPPSRILNASGSHQTISAPSGS